MKIEDVISSDSASQTVVRMQILSAQCLELFSTFFDAKHNCWPYVLRDGATVEHVDRFSASTVAMIVHACAISNGQIQNSVLAPSNRSWKPVKTDKDISAVISKATEILYEACSSNVEGKITNSTTWGKDDPLTLLWIYELVASDKRDEHSDLRRKLMGVASSRIKKALKNPDKSALDVESGAISHVFPLLRLIQLRSAIEKNESGSKVDLLNESTETATTWLDVQLHKQLSLSSIPNSEFDPATLIFALEGLLLIAPHKVTSLVVTRTLKVMHESARTGSYWRPVRPLRTTSPGYVLLPQSVEVANSLLRICSLRNEGGEPIEWQPLVLEALHSYTDWLEGRLVNGNVRAPGKSNSVKIPFVGWQSDHTHTDGMVHLWATSQTLLFCEHYGAFMQQHLARSLQRETAVKSALPTPGERDWMVLSLREPLLGIAPGSRIRAYDRIWKTVIQPRLNSQTPESSSILLYGPPGTGKTTLAEHISRALQFELIRITPSDFIQSGESGVEERSRRIFEMLMEQAKTVVLFDEIDNLLLSRDSKRYQDQSQMFQFMTPSMLIKLNDLHKKNEVIFIIATNYEERLDGAIKRAGRIDESILFLPPDLSQRSNIIQTFVGGKLTGKQISNFALQTPLFAFQELKQLCLEVVRVSKEQQLDRIDESRVIKEKVNAFEPAIALSQYKSRCLDAEILNRDGPLKEYLYLAYLVLEANANSLDGDALFPLVFEGGATLIGEEQVRNTLKAALPPQATGTERRTTNSKL